MVCLFVWGGLFCLVFTALHDEDYLIVVPIAPDLRLGPCSVK
jgi:hypothetical protein